MINEKIGQYQILPQDNNSETMAPAKNAYFNFRLSWNKANIARKTPPHQHTPALQQWVGRPNTMADLM
jgi:hypothetical protein